MSGEEDFDQLISAVREGDSAAITRLNDRLSRRLSGYIRRKIGAQLGTRVDTDDVLQQTVFELLRIIEKGDRPIRNLDLLSKAIAKNVVGQWARRKSICFQRLDAPPPGVGDDSPQPYAAEARGSGPRTKFLRKERNELIHEAIATLKPTQALIVRLRFFSPGTRKRKFNEIAEIVGMTPEATEKAYQRAKKRVQEFLQRNYPRSGFLGDL